MFSRDSVVTKS